MKKGEELRVSARTDEWWKGRTTSGVSGWFPKQRVRPITDPAQLKQVEAAFRKLAKKRAQQKASDGYAVPHSLARGVFFLFFVCVCVVVLIHLCGCVEAMLVRRL